MSYSYTLHIHHELRQAHQYTLNTPQYASIHHQLRRLETQTDLNESQISKLNELDLEHQHG